ncbi:MAG: di-trans,poly-cis-decaprenylcistransferase [Lachnospiraceae bacterium]|nr:di-trans,poly-cis-decaprenylcistransferase [Lachnospiraceae bacterium]
MDGNGRWAKKRGMPRTFGHAQGSENVEMVCEDAWTLGIKYLTVYAFSTENWKRPSDEVNTLMELFLDYLTDYHDKMISKNMRVRCIGDRTALSEDIQNAIAVLESDSSANTGLNFTIAINYGGRDEITRAVRNIVSEGVDPADITEETITAHLDTASIPDPDLVIRTSGEERLSNFMPWQTAYSEFYYTDVLWPDFDMETLKDACRSFSRRSRRHGGL